MIAARSVRSRRSLGWALALCFAAGACGWRAGLRSPELGVPAPGSVGVELFDVANGVLERNLEPRLHQAMTRAVLDWVHEPLVSPGDADWVVRGRINQYNRRGGIRSSDHLLLESGVRIDASAELVDRRSGETLGRSSRTSIWSGYATGDPRSEREAADRALRNVAETLILDLFGRPAPEIDAGVQEDG